MAIEIKHAFVSAKGDGGDATLVRPSNWNAAHNTSMATGKLIGRLTAGVGAFEEIPITAFMANALAAANAADFLTALGIGAFTTGDLKFSVSNVPANGWICYQGAPTIGKAGSGATQRANADTQALFELIYTNISNTYAPVSGGRTGNATTDFNAGKTIALPWISGRAIIGAGGGGSLTTRVLGEYAGAETHALSVAELAVHFHAASIYDPSHTHGHNAGAASGSSTGGGGFPCGGGTATISVATTGVRVNSANGLDTTYSAGSGSAHNNMQPYIPMWTHIKL